MILIATPLLPFFCSPFLLFSVLPACWLALSFAPAAAARPRRHRSPPRTGRPARLHVCTPARELFDTHPNTPRPPLVPAPIDRADADADAPSALATSRPRRVHPPGTRIRVVSFVSRATHAAPAAGRWSCSRNQSSLNSIWRARVRAAARALLDEGDDHIVWGGPARPRGGECRLGARRVGVTVRRRCR